jgi:putative ABC transport system substrate-binding protein
MLALGGAATWPIATRAQQSGNLRRIGFLTGLPAEDPEGEARLAAFVHGLAERGWTLGRNLQLDYRAASRDPDNYRRYAAELVTLKPEVLVAGGTPALDALRGAARTLPIVFANATEPSGGGYLARFARPARNVTGFLNFESRFDWKLLELMKQLSPRVTRVAILQSSTASGMRQMNSFAAEARRFGVELTALGDHDAGEIERGIGLFAYGPHDGLIVRSQLARAERERIIALAALARLPAVYPFRRYVAEGGLVSFGSDQAEPYRQAAYYVDRILYGEKPVDLPIQPPTKYQLVVNLKTAKALGLDLPAELLARADEVIE